MGGDPVTAAVVGGAIGLVSSGGDIGAALTGAALGGIGAGIGGELAGAAAGTEAGLAEAAMNFGWSDAATAGMAGAADGFGAGAMSGLSSFSEPVFDAATGSFVSDTAGSFGTNFGLSSGAQALNVDPLSFGPAQTSFAGEVSGTLDPGFKYLDPTREVVQGSLWEDVTTPFKVAGRMVEQANASPLGKGLKLASTGLNLAKTAGNMLNPPQQQFTRTPGQPQTVGGLQTKPIGSPSWAAGNAGLIRSRPRMGMACGGLATLKRK